MAKYKASVTNPRANGELGLTILSAVYSSLERFNERRVVYCGNPDCGHPIVYEIAGPRPSVCSKCGQSIDWVGIATALIIACPSCNRTYGSDDVFCLYHEPAVRLVTREVERKLP